MRIEVIGLMFFRNGKMFQNFWNMMQSPRYKVFLMFRMSVLH